MKKHCGHNKTGIYHYIKCEKCNVILSTMFWGETGGKAEITLETIPAEVSYPEYLIKNNQDFYSDADIKRIECADIGNNSNLLTLKDLKTITSELKWFLDILKYEHGMEEIEFTPVDFSRFRATFFLIKRCLSRIGFFLDKTKTMAYNSLDKKHSFYGCVALTI